MKLMIHWKIPMDKRHEVLAAFAAMDLNDYQTQQGSAINVIERWHDVINCTGVVICETDDAQALGQWLMNWNAVCDFEIAPVVDDEEAHAIAKKTAA
jgi:hypothetical protein